MSLSQDLPTVIQGEASESDEEFADPYTRTTMGVHGVVHGVVVAGEASESDEEYTDITLPLSPKSDVPPLKVNHEIAEPPKSKKYIAKKPKLDSLLHKKLREKNEELYRQLEGTVDSYYTNSAKDIRLITQNLSKSLTAIQDVSHNMRMLTNDLFHLEDKMDIISTCNLLPDINIEPLSPAAARHSPAKSSP